MAGPAAPRADGVRAALPAGFVVLPSRRNAARAGILADVAASWLRCRLDPDTLARLDLSDLAAQQMTALLGVEEDR